MSERNELSGWDEIAGYLGISVRAAQMREKELGLPVHRVPGAKGRVWAQTAEVDEWRRNRSAPKPDKSNPASVRNLTQVTEPSEKEPIVGTPTEVPPRQAVGPLTQLASRLPKRRYLVSAGLMFLLGSLALAWALIVPHGPPADFQVRGRDLIVVNDKGQKLWTHTFLWELSASQHLGATRVNRFWMGDLVGDGSQQIIFVASSLEGKNDGTIVSCFDSSGNRRWVFQTDRAVTDGSGTHMVPPYSVSSFAVVKGQTPPDTRIVFSSTHYLEQPDQVAVLDANGRVQAEYWHPGHLNFTEQLSRNGTSYVLLGGVNNANHQATLVMLNPSELKGVTTPKGMKDHRFGLLGMDAASEDTAVLFPRSCISKGQPYTRVSNLSVTKERIIVDVAESTSPIEPGFTYEFDHDLQILEVVPTGQNVAVRHQELEAKGLLDHRYDSTKETKQLKDQVVILRSRKS